MTKPINTYCNNGCQKPFNITKMRNMKVKAGIEKTYFRCTHCKHEYIAYYASAATKKLQKEIQKLQRETYTVGSPMDMKEFYQQEANLKSEIKRSMDEARAIAES